MNASESAANAEFGIDLRDISVSFKGRVIFSNACISAKRGEVVGFIGPNGSGKSTMLRVLAGLVVPRRGDGYVLGCRLDSCQRSAFGMMFENPPFIEEKTGSENLVLLARLKGMRQADVVLQCRNCMERVGLDCNLSAPVKRYSQGMRKRLGLAQALLGFPSFYLLDEPMNGLDPLGVIIMRNCIQELADQGSIVVISSHLLDELERVCSKVYMFHADAVFQVAPKEDGAGWLERAYVEHVVGKPIR